MVPTLDALRKFEGQDIGKICDGGYTDPGFNHCAHFLSHAFGYDFGLTCKGMTSKGSTPSSIRVVDLFARCPQVGKWADFKGNACLVFVTDAGNVHLKKKVLDNVSKKHVGVYLNGTIWHYSNTTRRVVTQTPAEFNRHYPGKSIALFYGTLPR